MHPNTLFCAIKKHLNSRDFQNCFDELGRMVIAVAKNIEAAPNDFPKEFQQLQAAMKTPNKAKICIFNSKLSEAFAIASIPNFLSAEECQTLKELIQTLYENALEQVMPGERDLKACVATLRVAYFLFTIQPSAPIAQC